MKVRKIFMLNHLSSYINSLGDALCQMGHKLYYQSSWNMKEIKAGIDYFRPDILLTVGFDQPMQSDMLEELPAICRKYNVVHLYWATEDDIHYENFSLPFVRRVKPDFIWSIHPESVIKYRKRGFQSDYVNFAFNPNLFTEKTTFGDEKYDISFVGSTHLSIRTYRYESLKQLVLPALKFGSGLNIWGGGWQENEAFLRKEFGAAIPSRGYMPYKNTLDVYHNSKIMLGVQNALDQVTQRTFEILGTGAFMIASRTDALEELFTDGKELVLSSSPEETLEKLSYYIHRPYRRQQIGRQARTKVLRYHTFSHRLDQVWPVFSHFLSGTRERAQ